MDIKHLFPVHQSIKNVKNVQCLKLEEYEVVCTILSVYAPNVEHERVRFFNGLSALFCDENEYICGGDFNHVNCVLDDKVDRLNWRSNIDVGQIELSHTKSNFYPRQKFVSGIVVSGKK